MSDGSESLVEESGAVGESSVRLRSTVLTAVGESSRGSAEFVVSLLSELHVMRAGDTEDLRRTLVGSRSPHPRDALGDGSDVGTLGT